MQKMTFALATLPGFAAAHGGHANLPEPSHGMVHAAPVVGVLVIGLAVGLALIGRWRS